jgi:hypothetical protein
MTQNEKIVVPMVHMNGTSKAELLEQQSDARQAIADAITALRKAAPHGRDYYPREGDAWSQAVLQHQNRVWKLQSVYDDLMQISLETNIQGN